MENKMNTLSRSTGNSRFALKIIAASMMLIFGAQVYALPIGGTITEGSASISNTTGGTTITQSTQNVAINWQSFDIGSGETVRFIQPDSSSVALNRVLGPDPSSILGSLIANGKVFLINPNGILFGLGSQVNVGGLVATTLNMTDSDFMAGRYQLSGSSDAAVTNQGTIHADDGGYIALLGAHVSNEGFILAKLGSVVMAAGSAITLDVAGDGLLNVTVSQGAVNTLVENGGMIQADGGYILLTAMAAGDLLQSAVNNTGVIQAQTIENRNGTIMLMGDMQTGTVNVGGTLDASAPNGGDGGFIETSAAHVKVANDVIVTTVAPMGQTGTWLIDPLDFYIAAAGGNISGATLQGQLITNNVTISSPAGAGNGDIFVNDAVSWTASGAPTTLTLNAFRDVNINAAITAINGNLVACCGRDVNVNAAITTTNGSVLLAAGRDVNLSAAGALTTTDGNLAICAGNDINVNLAAITLTRGSLIPAESLIGLGVPLGLTLSAGNDGTGPGAAAGTLIIDPGTPNIAVTGPDAPATIYYNPVSYAAPTDYLPQFTLTSGATLTQFMLVFPDGANKTFDGTTVATFTGLKGAPAGVTLGSMGTANFDTADVGINKTVTFAGFTLAGINAGNFAFANSCCGLPSVGKTTATITPAPVPVPPIPPGITPVLPIVPALPIDTAELVAEEMLGNEDGIITPAISLRPVPAPMPRIVLAGLPPQLLTIAPVVVPVVREPTPLPPAVAPAEIPPPVYAPPLRLPKQDRN
jgi:filamentous hemagglutinin family protein